MILTKLIMLRNINRVLFFAPVVFMWVVTFQSCTKKSEAPADVIVGKWTISSATIDASINGKSLSEYYFDAGSSQADADQIAQTFLNTIHQSYSGTLEFFNNYSYTQNNNFSTHNGTWTLSPNGQKLILDEGTSSESFFDVVVLDHHDFHITSSKTISQDLDQNNIPETIILNIDLKLSK